MGMWDAIAVIVVVFGLAKILRSYWRVDAELAHSRQMEIAPPSDETAILHQKITTLTERVKVLERIITETHRGQALAAEIEALRGPSGPKL